MRHYTLHAVFLKPRELIMAWFTKDWWREPEYRGLHRFVDEGLTVDSLIDTHGVTRRREPTYSEDTDPIESGQSLNVGERYTKEHTNGLGFKYTIDYCDVRR
jgi:hypothetical protein